jgi:hypothetical protein
MPSMVTSPALMERKSGKKRAIRLGRRKVYQGAPCHHRKLCPTNDDEGYLSFEQHVDPSLQLLHHLRGTKFLNMALYCSIIVLVKVISLSACAGYGFGVVQSQQMIYPRRSNFRAQTNDTRYDDNLARGFYPTLIEDCGA